MKSTISTLAAQLVAERAALEARPHSDAEAAPILDALTEREFEILQMPSQSARDLAIKIHLSAREYLENEGTLSGEIIREVDTLIDAENDADLIDPPQDREQRAQPRQIIAKTPDPFEPIVAEVDALRTFFDNCEVAETLTLWDALHRSGQADMARDAAEGIKAMPDSRARRMALYLIEAAVAPEGVAA